MPAVGETGRVEVARGLTPGVAHIILGRPNARTRACPDRLIRRRRRRHRRGRAGRSARVHAAGLRVALIGPVPRLRVPTVEAPFDPRIYALAGASIRLLEDLRAWPQVDRGRTQPVARMQVEGDRGGSLSFDAYAAAVDRLATIVEECELLRALWIACGFASALSHLDDSFERARSGRRHGARATHRRTHNRKPAGARCRRQESAVRAAAGFNAIETPHRQTALVANFACAQAHRGVAHQWFTDEGVVALLPLPGQRVSLVWSAPQELAAELLALGATELAARVAARTQGGWAL